MTREAVHAIPIRPRSTSQTGVDLTHLLRQARHRSWRRRVTDKIRAYAEGIQCAERTCGRSIVVEQPYIDRMATEAGHTHMSLPLKSLRCLEADISIFVNWQQLVLVVQAGRKRPRRLSNPRLTACRDRQLM